MQGNYQEAFAHLNSGLKILGDCVQKNENDPNGDSESNMTQEFIRSELLPLFRALDIQTTTILPNSLAMTTASTKFNFRTQNSIPNSISSLNEAKYHLQNQTHAILEYHRSVTQNHSLDTTEKADASRSNNMDAIMEEKRNHDLKLEQWSTVFHSFAQTAGQTMDTKDLRASISLELDYETNKLILETALFETEIDYDRYIDQFELMTSLAESLLKSYSDSRTEHRPVFSFDTVIIPPLVFVVCKCRDPSIRRKAHTLLSTSLRREGLWDSDYASSIGKWYIDKEEKGLEYISRAEEVLEATKIVVLGIISLGRRRALIKFRQGPCRKDGDLDLQEELIVW